MYAGPPVHPDAAFESDILLSFLSQMLTGPETPEVAGQEQAGLQQSQNRVLVPEPESWAAPSAVGVASKATTARLRRKRAIALVSGWIR